MVENFENSGTGPAEAVPSPEWANRGNFRLSYSQVKSKTGTLPDSTSLGTGMVMVEGVSRFCLYHVASLPINTD
ncbi:MAG: hypothetical protein ACI82O_004040 [Patiriisocius sp.]|jgi:hypothetical protein